MSGGGITEIGEGVYTTEPRVRTVVLRITAKVPGTRGVRNSTNARPADQLRPSTDTAMDFASNAPNILVQGCNAVELEAITDPPDKPVVWRVLKNQNSNTPPTLTPVDDGRRARLATNVQGAFSVMASGGDGGTFVVWNVVFVGVRVLVDTTVATPDSTQYADNGSTGGWTKYQSGRFVPGTYAWQAQVDVRVLGGTDSGAVGRDKVQLKVLQNGTGDTLAGHYHPRGTAREVVAGGLPILDATNASQPFVWAPTAARVTPNQTNETRRVWTGDSPAGAFVGSYQFLPHHAAATLASISGVLAFRTMIASVSDDAPNSIVVHAQIRWSADYAGTVSAAGIYTPQGAKTTSNTQYQLISPDTGGQDAYAARAETFEPRWNAGLSFRYSP